jgi:enamine deaminase RidA (YjgF/YER057c/UK114 family)
MTDQIEEKLAELGLSLPEAAAPVAAYVPTVEAGGLLHISGQLPFRDGEVVTGQVGTDLTVVQGQQAAELCGLMLVAQIRKALGGFDRVERIVKLGVFVNAAPGFAQQPEVANSASSLMMALFGESGRHARAAVGVASLPRNAAVEVDAIVALKP